MLAQVLLAACVSHALAFHGILVDDVSCEACNSSQFCAAGERFHCPANSDSEFPAHEITDCVCRGGFLRQNNTCVLGRQPRYYSQGQAFSCGRANTITITDGASVEAQCVCVRGFELGAAGTCVKCNAQSYATYPNTTCVLCPDHSQHPGLTGSSDIRQCACDPGSTGSNGSPCSLCPPGTTKSVRGNSTCVDCAADTFADALGTVSLACSACHANSSSAAGSAAREHCRCDPGFEPSGPEACVPCAAGKVKASGENANCTLCPAGRFQDEAGQTGCDDCGLRSVPVSDHDECVCQAKAYEANKTNGLAVCLECPVNTFQPDANQQTCDLCPEHKLSPAGSEYEGDCRCEAGYFESVQGQACSKCAGGTYKTYTSYDDYEVCKSCPDYALSGAASTLQTDCICNAGYSGPDGGTCTACPAGTFKAANGSAACSVCPINTYENRSASTACASCMPRSLSLQNSTSIVDCACDEGVGRLGAEDNPRCVPCEPGEYEDYTCLDCPEGQFTNSTRATKCFHCEDHSSTWSSESIEAPNIKCDCDPGYTTLSDASAPVCTACPADAYKTEPGDDECDTCHPDSQSLPASIGRDQCLCNVGFHLQYYQLYRPGYVSHPILRPQCLACPSDHYQPEIGKDECLACPAHSHTLRNTSTALVDCICDIGFSGPDGGPCEACDPGSYKEFAGNASCELCPADHYQPASSASACLQCQAFSFTLPGAVELARCTCNDGFTPVAGPLCLACAPGTFSEVVSQVCTNCSGGNFSSEHGVTACSVCPSNSLSHEKPHVACQCDAGYVRGNAACVACAADRYKDRFGATGCQDCQSNAQSPAASTTQAACRCNIGYEQDGEAACEICAPGTFSDSLDTPECPACPHPTFAGRSGLTACTHCLHNSSVNDTLSGCDCHVGFTSDGSDATGAEECVECKADTYKDATGNDACTACQSHAQSVAGAVSFEQCLCREGYQRVGRECVACPVGTFKDHTNNSYQCASCTPDLTFSGGLGAEECTVCTAVCLDATPADTRDRRFASRACNATHDVGCSPCTVCAAGTYATEDSLCRDARNRDRNDTACAQCPADSHCAGHMKVEACPESSHSPAGSSAPGACVCVPGRHMTEDRVCEECPLNHFCANNAKTACPAHALTRHRRSSVLLDCTCRNGHYKNESSEAHFKCALCTENDYCFNNSLYNCSDERMETERGAASAADCRCVAGFYNNGSRCEECKADSFCDGGNTTACADDRWTQGKTAQEHAEDCLCRPGLYQPHLQCAPCLKNHFCEGDNTAYPCPQNSTTLGTESRTRCECDAGFRGVLAGNVFGCERCPHGLVKEEPGNQNCSLCDACNASRSFENSACLPANNRFCEVCTVCQQPQFRKEGCTIQEDTVCSNCTVCDFAEQIETHACNEDTQDAVCETLNRGLVCTAGSVAGNHTRYLQPHCLACRVHASADPANTWLEFTTNGAAYDNVYSCTARCLGLSELRDASNHSLGCATCETGNALFRNFSGVGCAFTCRPGYALNAAGDDCELPVLRQVRGNTLPSMSISNWRYGEDGHFVTIAHTDTNRFVVLVGAREVGHCEPRTCCYAGLIRVSTKQQMGLVARTAENCSRAYNLSHRQVSASKIEVYIRQAELPTVGDCTPDGAGMVCRVVVTLLDVTFWRPISQTLRLRVNTTGSVLALGVETKYLPLAALSATAILVRRSATAQLWEVALYMPADADTWNVSMRVHGMSFRAEPAAACGSYPGGVVLAQPSYTVSNATSTTFVARWESSLATATVSVLLHLQRGDAAMNVAVLRNMSGAVAQCQTRQPALRLATGEVRGGFGLGSAAVARLRLLSGGRALPHTGYGNAHRLVTFLAEGTTVAPVAIVLERLLVVYLDSNTSMLPNATATSNGKLRFRYSFRQWCRAHAGCEYEYIAQYAQRRNLLRVDCGAADAARSWIVSSVGAHVDAGHVGAVCGLVAAHSARHAVAYLAATGHVLARATWGAGAVTTHLFPAFRFSSTVG